MATQMLSARVNEADYRTARRILETSGMSVSQAVQQLINFIARTGELPACLVEDDAGDSRRQEFSELMWRIEARPRVPWPEGVSDDELLGEERMRRFG